MLSWFKHYFDFERDPSLPKINDIRIVKETYYMPDGETYDKFNVEMYYELMHEDWHSVNVYNALPEAEESVKRLQKKYWPVKVDTVVVKEYKQ